MKALKAYNTEAITKFHQRKVYNTEIVETPQDYPPGPLVPENDLPNLPEGDINIPDDPILDFVNSQCHNSEDLDQALWAYQAYQVPYPQDSTMTPERLINHHFTYHIAQASQAKHGSLVDRGANGGLDGSDVRILSRSSWKCTVTGIDSHELQGHDVVQCAALVQTNHGIVNLIMNEFACYGKGHGIHSSGQPTNSCGTTNSDKIFLLPPKIKIPNLHIDQYTYQFEQYHSHRQNAHRPHPSWAPTKEPTSQTRPFPGPPGSYLSRLSAHKFIQIKITIIVIPTNLNC